jgi:short-subunit dehydrogenase
MFLSTRDARKGIHRLSGSVAVVTGAAGGIGRALSLQLREKGCQLALVDIDARGLEQFASELRGADVGPRVTTHEGNVADAQRMQQISTEVIQAHGAVHVLVNSAGVAYEAPFPQTSLEDWRHVVDANFWSVVVACRTFLPHLAKVERGHIVNLSSLFGIIAMPGQTAYCATKFAVRGFSEALHEELRATSVGVTVVHPGAVATNIMRSARGDDPELLRRLAEWYERNAIPPERAAAQIVRAIERGTPRLVITAEAKVADILKRLLPVSGNSLFVDAVIRGLGVSDMRAKRMRQWNETMVGAVDGKPGPQ